MIYIVSDIFMLNYVTLSYVLFYKAKSYIKIFILNEKLIISNITIHRKKKISDRKCKLDFQIS